MVVAEQVQDAVDGEQVDLVGGRVSGGGRLLCRHLRAQRDVAEVALGFVLGVTLAAARVSLSARYCS